jgi:probable selenium-dependent hydroxylase accessory protein YqeC
MSLVETLAADVDMVAVVGAGGKKTTLYALAQRLDRAVVTATVRIPHFDAQVADVFVAENPLDHLRTAGRWPVGAVREREPDRYVGYDTATVVAMAASDVTGTVLVKADGARTRWLKAPAQHEPQIPTTADTVIPVVSARVVGEPLDDEAVHRPERVARLTGLGPGDPIAPSDVAEVLTHREGGLKDVPPSATTVPLVNMVDDAELESTARDIADEILARRPTLPRVVLARMDEPTVVDVVESPERVGVSN